MKQNGIAIDLRAVLFATPRASADLPVAADFPAALLPLGHATLVECLLEQLALAGATEIDIVVCDRPEGLRAALGDGERWGVRLRWHLARDPERPYAMLRLAQLPQSRRVVIGHADRWIGPAAIRRLLQEDQVLLQLDRADALAWTGWASVPGAMLRSALSNFDQRELGAELMRRGLRPSVLPASSPAPVLDAQGLLEAQRAMTGGGADAPLPAASITMSSGALSPLARVDPAATIVGPVLIGPSLVGRFVAAIAATVLLPGLALAVLGKRRREPLLPWGAQQIVVGLDAATRRTTIVPLRCPRGGASGLRRALGHYGGLLDVLQGRRCWFGVRPRRSGEWYALSPAWQSMFGSGPVGLLNAPAWEAEDAVRMEACAAADAYYMVRRNWRENIRIALAALRAVRSGARRTPPLPR